MYGYYEYDHGSAPDPSLRAADADRESTADRLRQNHAEGRIDVTEFQERLDQTYKAKTVGELQQVVRDLPGDPRVRRARGARLRPAWAVPWIPLLLLIVALSAASGHHHPGPWVLIPLFFLTRFLWRGGRWSASPRAR